MKHKPRFRRLLYDPVKNEKKLEDNLNEIAEEGYCLHTVLQTPQGTMFIFEYDGLEVYTKFDRAHETLKKITTLPGNDEAKEIASKWMEENSSEPPLELLAGIAGNVTKD